MDTAWLLDFLALEATRSFSEAARQRNTSQSAFSRHIQSLEHWLGARLVDRATVPITLTPQGELFAERARKIANMLEDARSIRR